MGVKTRIPSGTEIYGTKTGSFSSLGFPVSSTSALLTLPGRGHGNPKIVSRLHPATDDTTGKGGPEARTSDVGDLQL